MRTNYIIIDRFLFRIRYFIDASICNNYMHIYVYIYNIKSLVELDRLILERRKILFMAHDISRFSKLHILI